MDSQVTKQGDTEKDQEIVLLRKKVSELESQLGDAQKLIQKHLLEANEVDVLKMRSADTLTKAKSVIFENTKMIKNQELQIQALNQQVESLRDVVKITKDLLEIRNLEVDQLESKIHCMEEKYKAEKERQDLMHQKLEQMIRHNGELKREYEAQLCLFQALRERYSERELAKGVVETLRADIRSDKSQTQTEKDVEQTKQNAQNLKNDTKNCEEGTQSEDVQKTNHVNKDSETEKEKEHTISEINSQAEKTSPTEENQIKDATSMKQIDQNIKQENIVPPPPSNIPNGENV
ncbi:hypothetical protein HHI36_011912 [Cryptolaemus montrouzieri]|uniref:Uncharacterized protein n=1 Tax=Cryptolaemus montrouzieri TaxID=559131 RepID=A0ABD2NDI5_9CUCU